MSGRQIRAFFVVPDLRVGGAERHVTTLLPRMDPSKFTSSVMCIGEEGDLYPALSAAGIEARALHLKKRQAPRALFELVAAMRRFRPDVVVVRGYNAEMLGRIAARLTGVEHVIIWVHNIGDATPRSSVRAAIDRALNRWTSRYFGVAEAQRSYLVDELGYPHAKIRIVYNGVDPELFDTTADRSVLREFGFAENDPVVGIVAALSPEKDHPTLLRAARIVVDEIPRARFLVIGDGPTRPHLESLCSELGITPNVCFTGSRSDVARLLRAIDVFALSSVTVECFPIALLEAMACARPAVCTAVGGIREMISDGETGYLVPPEDPHSSRLGSSTCCRTPIPRAAWAVRAAIAVETEFSLDRSVTAASQAIEDVVNGQVSHNERVKA